MRHAFALFVLVVLAGCFAPSQHDPHRFAPVHIAFGTPLDTGPMGPGPWRMDELKELRAELVSLNAYGPDFVETDEGHADFIWRPFDSTQSDPQHRKCGSGAARFTLGGDYGEIDPVCCAGYDELRTAAGHETGHKMGLPHICQHYEVNPSCDPRWVGDAMMNPSLSYVSESGPEEPQGQGDFVQVSQPRPTSLDIAAYNATRTRAAASSGGSR